MNNLKYVKILCYILLSQWFWTEPDCFSCIFKVSEVELLFRDFFMDPTKRWYIFSDNHHNCDNASPFLWRRGSWEVRQERRPTCPSGTAQHATPKHVPPDEGKSGLTS